MSTSRSSSKKQEGGATRNSEGSKRRGGASAPTGNSKGIEPMRSGVIAKKVGMTRIYNDAGE
ncbi:MAG: hypothetical protein E5X90_16600, partial [Mesorhizobium sp.]